VHDTLKRENLLGLRGRISNLDHNEGVHRVFISVKRTRGNRSAISILPGGGGGFVSFTKGVSLKLQPVAHFGPIFYRRVAAGVCRKTSSATGGQPCVQWLGVLLSEPRQSSL
jgi:hypothetical protein